ncbi:MAG: crossover junction endodeoxyribonuclease RuvC [Bacillota bacterium]|nr:crossover junction endodeoxyribonuclease RuvC [Bacillota bacterium]REJ37233.1 MAG: crossover junction endodeoxyribonuclease RuvC [Bacillota bacterium]
MKILGIDPGTAVAGFGIIEGGLKPRALEYGAIRTPPGMEEAERLVKIHARVRDLIEAWSPDVLAVEQVFFNKNTRSALAVGQARGVVLLAAAQAGIPVHEFTPLEVKLAVTGQGRADKRQVGYMIQALLGLDAIPRPDDVADALAVALTCLQTLTTRRRWQAAAQQEVPG